MGLRDYLAMTRPVNSFMSGVGAAMALALYEGYRPGSPWPLLLAFATGYLSTASSMLVNDYVDAYVDSLNKPWKPIPSGRARPVTVRNLGFALAALSVLLNAAASPLLHVGLGAFAVVLAYTLLGSAYSYSRRFWWSHFLVSASTTGPVVYGFTLAGAPGERALFTLVFSIVVFTVTTGREIVKSLQDMEGDRRAGYRTIPIVFGVEAARRGVLVAGLASIPLSWLAYLAGGNTVFLALITLAALAYLAQCLSVYKNPFDKERLEKARVGMMASMLLGLTAFWASGL